MDKNFTVKELRNFSWNLNAKYKHFNELYRQKLNEFHQDELLEKAYKEYIKRKPNPYSDTTKTVEAKLYGIKQRMKFIQDELSMYKHEMMMWREISMKVERAYNYIINNLREKIEGFGQYTSHNRFNGDDITVHVIITGYGNSHYKHTVLINIVNEDFGELSKYQHCF